MAKVKLKSSKYIAQDTDVTVQVTQVLNGKESAAKEITLKAEAQAPRAPQLLNPLNAQPGETATIALQTEPNTTIEVVSCSFGTASVSGNDISVKFPASDKDVPVTLIVKAKRGTLESPEKVIYGTAEVKTPKALQIVGPIEMLSSETAKFALLNPEAGVTYTGVSNGGTLKYADGAFTLTPDITTDKVITLTFTGTRKSKSASKQLAIKCKYVYAEPVAPKKYKTIKYAKGEGTGSMKAEQVEVGSKWVVPESKFTPPAGKQFKEWSYSTGGGDAKTAKPGAKIDIGTEGTLTATAIYEAIPTPVEPETPEA